MNISSNILKNKLNILLRIEYFLILNSKLILELIFLRDYIKRHNKDIHIKRHSSNMTTTYYSTFITITHKWI